MSVGFHFFYSLRKQNKTQEFIENVICVTDQRSLKQLGLQENIRGMSLSEIGGTLKCVDSRLD